MFIPAIKHTLQGALSVAVLMVSSASFVQAADEKRNVILIIGDGMDDQQITIARNYLKGANGRLLLDAMALRSTSHILTVEDAVSSSPVYVADSANSATSMATGQITSIGRIATSAGEDKDIITIAELAKAAGFSTGVVSSASVTDATPASFIAHVISRDCENPTRMSVAGDNPSWVNAELCKTDRVDNGGAGSIAQQIALGSTDVVLGGGMKHFQPRGADSDKTLLKMAQDNGYQLVTNAAELMSNKSSGKLLGLFSEHTMPTRLRGEDGRIAERPLPSLLYNISSDLGSVVLPESMRCEENPDYAGMTSIKQMTDAAIKHLSTKADRGFFLMVESASIDKASHKRNACGSIGELAQLEEALASAQKFAADHPNTLILVTADHGQAAQLIPNPKAGQAFYTPGHIARITTPEGQIMAINYATTEAHSEKHTGTNVPLFANIEGQGRVPSMVTQPEIFNIMSAYLGLIP